ncbi:MAG: LarC family nickel insertion protein [Negativibacillus massiliensis]|nr:LarC family nickel insertion protein [Negativibacillus massiliensis]
MKTVFFLKGKKSRLGAQECRKVLEKLIGKKIDSLAEGLKTLSVKKIFIEPLCFGELTALQRAAELGVEVCVSAGEADDAGMLEELEKIRQSGIEVEFTQKTEAVKVILAEEEIGETFSALVVIGEEPQTEQVALLSCNIDDSTGEELGWAMEKLLEEGAKDVFFIPIQMKKNRPAVMLNVLCGKGEEQKFAKILMQNTSTIGVRWSYFDRAVMQREVVTVKSPWGELKGKRCSFEGISKTTIEYESAKKAAREYGCPVGRILRYFVDWSEDSDQKS